MVAVEEHLLFIKELGRLFDEYAQCENKELKNEIYKDIQLLGEAINISN
ncbi:MULTISPECIES: hypothetical protein [unclassified Bacillus (in: firmicutes)]|nr:MULTISPECIES: hypothetical protein [unclassified Bacillus (in: firmicutes)]MBT2639606.1 hypothetical protein [Bacillus sp. ISL-39]MBT2661253.1 hypothetical protein [Bacillus sp. ISL-45]